MSNPAQDEFNQLVSSKETLTHHPEDLSEGEDSDTLVDEKTGQSSSIKGSRIDDGDSSDADSETYPLAGRKPATYSLPKKYTYNANTGPKGVIADAQAFEQEKGVGNKRTYIRTEDFVLPKNQRLAGKGGNTQQAQNTLNDNDNDNDNDDDDNEDGCDDDDDDDEILRKWRERRVSELQKGNQIRKEGHSKGRYGIIKAVDAMGFLEAVENVPAKTVVVVFVYDDEEHISDIYQTHIASLAFKYANIKFLALHYEEAEIERAGVPAILAYQDGEQFASILPLKEEVSIEDDVTTNLEERFRRYQIL